MQIPFFRPRKSGNLKSAVETGKSLKVMEVKLPVMIIR